MGLKTPNASFVVGSQESLNRLGFPSLVPNNPRQRQIPLSPLTVEWPASNRSICPELAKMRRSLAWDWQQKGKEVQKGSFACPHVLLLILGIKHRPYQTASCKVAPISKPEAQLMDGSMQTWRAEQTWTSRRSGRQAHFQISAARPLTQASPRGELKGCWSHQTGHWLLSEALSVYFYEYPTKLFKKTLLYRVQQQDNLCNFCFQFTNHFLKENVSGFPS